MLVFCTTCKGRTAHLRETLPRNLVDNPDSRFLVLDYNSQDDLLDFLRSLQKERYDGRLVVYSYRGHHKFRMAHAKNLAHRLGIIEGASHLLNLDADNFAGRKFERWALERFADPDVFLWTNKSPGDGKPRGINGRIAVSRETFLKVGGYDEKYHEWSPDDKDFDLRLRMCDYRRVEIDAQFLQTVPHNDKVRFKEYPHLEGIEMDAEFRVNRDTCKCAVVNAGKLGCGTVFRNFNPDDIVQVKPLPSRIFGIGYPKTGTVTLHKALGLLGYDSWHWSSAHVAKAIWREMNGGERSLAIDRHQALCDLPIPLLYGKLDASYPGSKFILTIRNEQNWLESMRRHFLPEHNPFRAGWDNDPFSNRVHHLAFGRGDFEPESFLARYRQHNAEVQEYFKHRPNDLVLLHLDKKHGWGKLCQFLDKPEPNIPFPHENASSPLAAIS